MNRVVLGFLGGLFFALLSVSSVSAITVVPSQPVATTSGAVQVSSYELFYPIVAGMVPGDFWHFLKSFREGLVEKITFGDVKKADYHLTLSKKRLVEAEKLLLVREDYSKASVSLNNSVNEINKSLETAQKAQEKGKKVRDLYNALSGESSKMILFLGVLKTQVPADQQQPLQTAQESFGSIIAKIQTIEVDQ